MIFLPISLFSCICFHLVSSIWLCCPSYKNLFSSVYSAFLDTKVHDPFLVPATSIFSNHSWKEIRVSSQWLQLKAVNWWQLRVWPFCSPWLAFKLTVPLLLKSLTVSFNSVNIWDIDIAKEKIQKKMLMLYWCELAFFINLGLKHEYQARHLMLLVNFSFLWKSSQMFFFFCFWCSLLSLEVFFCHVCLFQHVNSLS